MRITDVPLASVIYGGLDNWGLRLIAAGKPGYFNMSRNYREAALLTAFSQQCRDQDMDLLLSSFARSEGMSYGSTEEKAEVTTKAAKMLLNQLQEYGPQREQEKLLKRIAELENANKVPPVQEVQPVQQVPKPAVQPVHTNKWNRKDGQDPLLHKTAPTSAKVKDVKAWVTNQKLSKLQKSKATEIADKIQEEVDNKPVAERGLDLYRACVVDWGLPFGMAAALDAKSLFTILGTVISITSK